MRIGILGGTFDPIHNGHLMLAEKAYEQFGLDEIWFLPNGNPPHKDSAFIESAVCHRTAMVGLAISGCSQFRLEPYEVERKEISYSYETMEYFASRYRQDFFYFIIGADSLFAIETWKHPERLFSACTILATFRDEIDTSEEMYQQIDYLEQRYRAHIELFKAPLMKVSSHELRDRLRNGESIAGYVPEEVEEYIAKEGLYGRKDQKAE